MAIRLKADPDPILDQPWRVRAGMNLDEYERRHLRRLVCDPDHNNWCKEPVPEGKAVHGQCSRPAGHPAHWKHVAATNYQIIATWGGGDAPKDGEFVDPEDGTPEDPAESVVPTEAIVPGAVLRLKDRKNKLQVIGKPGDRSDGDIDVLDLEKREYRAVPATEMVVDPAAVLTVDDLLFSIEYAQRTRMKIKDEAVASYHLGRWCEAGLQDALRDLGLPKYVPTQTGYVSVQVPYSAVSGMNTSKVRKLVEDALSLDDLKALIAAKVDPEDDDELEVKTTDLKVKVENVGRR